MPAFSTDRVPASSLALSLARLSLRLPRPTRDTTARVAVVVVVLVVVVAAIPVGASSNESKSVEKDKSALDRHIATRGSRVPRADDVASVDRGKRRDDTATPFEGDDGGGIVERRPGIVFARVIPFMTAASGTDARDDVEDDFGYDDPDVRYDDHVAREALRAFVRTALEETRRGGSHRAQYYELLEACAESARATDGDADGATALMDALCSYATLIDERTHHQLVERAFLRVDPWTCARRVRETALRFGTQLVCAQGGTFSGAVVGKLVESMIAPVEYDEWWREDADEADEEAMERARVGRRVVEDVTSCAGNILRLVPQSERTMIAALRTGIPHKSSPKAMQVGYMRAAFALVESERGAPLRDEFLKAVVAHALDVDVEIKWDDVMADAERTSADRGAKREEEEDDAIFELDDIEKTIEEQCRAEWEQRPATSAPLAVDEAADTLDALMKLALTHIDKRIDDGDVVLVRRALMHAFTLTLLPAPRSKFVQFLVFHLCSRDEETCRELTELLFTKLVDVSEAGSIRLAAAAYFASFLARAKHLTPEFVCDLLKRLVDWCLSHVKQRTTPGSVALSGAMEKTKVGMPPPPPHQALAVFDSACQAMMYVICYRAEDISRAGGTTAMKLQSLPLCEVLYSHLRPLATCLPSVVTEFLHRAVGANMNGSSRVFFSKNTWKGWQRVKERTSRQTCPSLGILRWTSRVLKSRLRLEVVSRFACFFPSIRTCFVEAQIC